MKVTKRTLVIDLEKPIEELWKEVNRKSGRWAVNYAIKHGLTFGIEFGDEVWDKFYEMLSKNVIRQGRQLKPKSLFVDVKKFFNRGFGKVFTVKHGKSIIAVALIEIDGDNMSLFAYSWDEDYKILQPTNFLMWKLIEFGSNARFKEFDLKGVYETGSKFKRKFGGFERFFDDDVSMAEWFAIKTRKLRGKE